MIITRIRGGLGNQLFQYAAGQAASLRHDRSHFLDLRFYNTDKYRDYGLGKFKISANVAPNEALPPSKETELLRYATWKYSGTNPRYVKDMDFVRGVSIAPQFAKSKFTSDVYMAGLWCSEYFFNDFASEVRKELVLKDELSAQSKEILNRINSQVSVSLHVRRGDFAQNRAVNTRFGVCSTSYYTSAINLLATRLREEFCLFVFSDDLQWARENIQFRGKVLFVSAASSRVPHEDLILMAACDHHITSNSTFSWWGAWLDANPKKLVVCPEKWYVARRKCKYRITPDRWIPRPAFS